MLLVYVTWERQLRIFRRKTKCSYGHSSIPAKAVEKYKNPGLNNSEKELWIISMVDNFYKIKRLNVVNYFCKKGLSKMLYIFLNVSLRLYKILKLIWNDDMPKCWIKQCIPLMWILHKISYEGIGFDWIGMLYFVLTKSSKKY